MKISKQELADILDDASDFDASNEQAFDVRKALLAGTLEIEGYERNGWIKFNPDDESTYPPVGEQITVYYDPSLIDEEYEIGFAVFLNTPFPPWLTYWRPPMLKPRKEAYNEV